MLGRELVLLRLGRGRSGEAGAMIDELLELADGNPGGRIGVKDHAQDVVEFIGQGQNGLQEVPVLAKCPVRGILLGRLLPWIAAASQVHQDDS